MEMEQYSDPYNLTSTSRHLVIVLLYAGRADPYRMDRTVL